MKFAIWMIVGGCFFLLTLSVSAGTFLETFDKFDLKDWEGTEPWRFVGPTPR